MQISMMKNLMVRWSLPGRDAVLLLALVASIASCDASRRSRDSAVIRTAPGADVVRESEVTGPDQGKNNAASTDTSRTAENLVDKAGPPDEGNYTEILSSYNVVLMLPFLTDRFEPAKGNFNSITKWSLNFYAGAKMALDELRRQNLGLQFSVFDTKGSESAVNGMLEKDDRLKNAHLIIGPYRRMNIQKVAEFARARKINVVSPYSAASNLTSENPHYIQVRPSIETHCHALLEHALRTFRPDQIALSGQNRSLELKSFEHFQDALRRSAGTRNGRPLQTFTVESNMDAFQEMNLAPLLEGRDTVVFMVSAWSEDDENFVYSFLRSLDLARREEQHIVVYGTPVWQDFDRVDMDYYEKLHLHLSSYMFIDPSSQKIRAFRRSYFDRHGTLPTEEAYLGYDTTLFFGEMLKKYGTRFEDDLEKEEMQGLHTHFAFERVVRMPETTGLENAPIQQFENKFVNILRFENYQFQLDR